ncbi:MAG: hypothetical protein GY805_38380 [Chloroflexi bacterium]|nr:hypothetical protein [Chloroflexota bacterium]
MSNSLLTRKTVFRTGFVLIKSDMDIQSLGKIISQKILKGLAFGGLDQYIRDEIPAIYIDGLLGCRIILQGFPGKDEYNLVVQPTSIVG